jgi:subtilase family serine protease
MFLRLSASILFFSLAFTGTLGAQVRPRIVERPDNGVVVRLPGTVHPSVATATEIGRAPGNLPMERMLLHLQSSPEQEAALVQLLADQQDPSSPRYHVWLTPEQFGEQFGAARQDLDAVAGWLQSQGFQVTEVAAGRRAIEFSGAARQVEIAFRTQINRYEWNGRQHTANATDISLPEALAPVVAGVVSLHDFGARPLHHVIPSTVAPQTDFSGGVHGLSPYDFAAIYNVAPLWTAGYDGTGQSIAIIGETNIKVSDVTSFRATFGLPVNNPTVIVNGTDPGILAGEETEADLDVEWSGAVAKGASIKLVTSASTNTSDGITLSAQYIVQHATAPVMSLSYGLCEAQMGTGNQFYSSLWQQAAAEGIAVFVASGDSGSAGCDVPYSASNAGKNTTAPASQGFGVNGLASTPYNVSVGGTEFNDTASPSTYWNTSNSAQNASAKGYIPEIVWNESSYTAGSSGNSLYAAAGGASIVWPRPSWQTGPGVPSGSMRLTPDVSLSASGHDGYVIEEEGALYLVGGTSASTPSFAGLMAIVNQYTNTTNGNPNGKFYALASSVPSVYHDITTGSNAVPCQGGSANCSAAAPSTNVGTMNGYSAGAGYDLATGLGSVDANALVTNWDGTAAGPGITSLGPNPMTGSAASQNLTINGAGFVAGTGLQVKVGTVTYQGSAVGFVSSAQLVVSANVGVSAQSLAVQVTNPNGQAGNSASLTVNAPSVAPAIATLNPNPMTGSSSAQSLTINGSGFVAGTGLQVTVGTAKCQGAAVNFVSSSQLVVSVNVGASAQNLAVQVTNPSGQASNSVSLAVSAPAVAPAIVTLSPNPMTGSSSVQLLTINGSGFVAGVKVTVGGTVYQGSQINFVSSEQLVASVNVGTSAQGLAVQVTNPNGQGSNTASLIVSPPSVAPAIATLNPNPMTASNSAQPLTINGSGFIAGVKVTVGGTVYQGSQINFVSSTQLVTSVNVGAGAQNLAVQVTNPSGQASNSVSLIVSPPSVAPAIATLSPNPMTGSSSAQSLTINGSGFVAGVKVTVGGTAYQGSQINFVSSAQLVASVNVGASAQSLAVQVTNPSGQASNTVNLMVNAPSVAPAIASLNPNPMTGSGSAQLLGINGSGFVAGVKVTVGGTAYQGSQVVFVSSSQLSVSVNVGASAQSLAVQVTNPNGQASNTVSLTVNAPSVPPAIVSLNPNPMTALNSVQLLTINGSGFVFGSGLKATVGGTAYQGSQVSFVNSSELLVSVNVGASAQSLAVQVTNPNGQVSNSVSLTVNAPTPPPAIATISPNPMTGSNSGQTLTINGSGFLPGLKLSIGGTAITANQLATLTPTALQVNVITGLTAHTYAVQVVNANGLMSNTVNLQVNAPPAPAIASLTPNPLSGATAAQVLTVNGTNFQSGAGLRVTVGSAVYTGSQVDFVSASQLKVTVAIPSGSKTLAVVVTNPSGEVSNAASLTVK